MGALEDNRKAAVTKSETCVKQLAQSSIELETLRKQLEGKDADAGRIGELTSELDGLKAAKSEAETSRAECQLMATELKEKKGLLEVAERDLKKSNDIQAETSQKMDESIRKCADLHTENTRLTVIEQVWDFETSDFVDSEIVFIRIVNVKYILFHVKRIQVTVSRSSRFLLLPIAEFFKPVSMSAFFPLLDYCFTVFFLIDTNVATYL